MDQQTGWLKICLTFVSQSQICTVTSWPMRELNFCRTLMSSPLCSPWVSIFELNSAVRHPMSNPWFVDMFYWCRFIITTADYRSWTVITRNWAQTRLEHGWWLQFTHLNKNSKNKLVRWTGSKYFRISRIGKLRKHNCNSI